MADIFDLVTAVAASVNASVQPLVGNTIPLYPSIDAATFGPTEVCPPIIVMPGNILLDDLMTRLEQGKCQIQVEADEANVPTPQYMAYEAFDGLSGPPTPLLQITVGR